MRTIAELLGRHANEEAWIFGKGPGLDAFDMASAGALRVCINESLLVVPDPTYFFAHDEGPIRRVAEHWPRTCRAILQPIRAEFAAVLGVPRDMIHTYTKLEREFSMLDWPASKIAQQASLLGLTGTVHSAIHFCRLIGATSLAFVGMDGTGGYAKSLGIPTPLGGGQHDVIRRDSITVAERLGLAHRFVAARHGSTGISRTSPDGGPE